MPDSSPSSAFSASDRLMWRIERDPVLRSPVLAIGLLDREPEWHAVQATFARAVERVPRLRQRVRGGGRRSPLHWEDDPAFSLDYHLRRIRAPHPADMRTVLDLAAPWATAALDVARPPWECTLVEGLEGARAAFVLKFHHTITDGVGGVDLAGSVFDADRRGRAKAAPAAPEAAPTPGPTLLDRATDVGIAVLDAAVQPGKTVIDLRNMVRSIGRMLEPAPAPLSPVFLGRGLDRHLDIIELPLAQLREAGHVFGGSVNDVFLAGVGGALHDLHERLGHHVPALRVTMPISLRREGDPPGGNRFTPARFVLPIDDPDPAHRTQICESITRRWRDEPAVARSDALAWILDQLPDPVLTSVFGSMLKNIDVDAVDVPGLEADAFVGGARIERLWAFAPPTGAAMSITLLSHRDTACIGVLADCAAVDDAELLHTCLQRSFDELLDRAALLTTPLASSGAHR